MVRKALSGWQRLWIIVSLLLLIPFSVGAAHSLPSAGLVKKQVMLLHFKTEDVQRYFDSLTRDQPMRDAEFVAFQVALDNALDGKSLAEARKDLETLVDPEHWSQSGSRSEAITMAAVIYRAPPKEIERASKLKLNETQYETLRTQIRNAYASLSAQVVGIALAAWIATCAVIYGLGWSVGWVIEGFKKE